MEHHQHHDQELKLSVLLKSFKEYLIYLLKRIWLIAAVALLFGAVLYFIDSKKPVLYKASLKFMLADESMDGGNPLSGMLGQFGFGGGKGGTNLNKMQALLTTRKIIKKTLFQKTKIGGKEDYLANHYIDVFKMQEQWIENGSDDLANFYFKDDDFENFDRLNNSIANGIFAQVASFTLNGDLERAHLTSRFDDSGTDIVDLYFTSTSEEYSLEFLNVLYKVLSEFYISKSIAKHEATYKITKKRADSLKNAITQTQYRLANYKDTNRGIFKNKSKIKIEDLQRESYRLQGLYAEAARNLEGAKFALQSKTPFITPIDMPLYPLGAIRGNPRKALTMGLIVGGALTALLLIAWKFFRDILRKEEMEEKQKSIV